jgi:hypothetical protein
MILASVRGYGDAGAPIVELSGQFGIATPRLKKLASSLELEGLIELEPTPDHYRATPAGLATPTAPAIADLLRSVADGAFKLGKPCTAPGASDTPPDPEPLHSMLKSDVASVRLVEAIQRLSTFDSLVLILRCYEGLTFDAIASVLEEAQPVVAASYEQSHAYLQASILPD